MKDICLEYLEIVSKKIILYDLENKCLPEPHISAKVKRFFIPSILMNNIVVYPNDSPYPSSDVVSVV